MIDANTITLSLHSYHVIFIRSNKIAWCSEVYEPGLWHDLNENLSIEMCECLQTMTGDIWEMTNDRSSLILSHSFLFCLVESVFFLITFDYSSRVAHFFCKQFNDKFFPCVMLALPLLFLFSTYSHIAHTHTICFGNCGNNRKSCCDCVTWSYAN